MPVVVGCQEYGVPETACEVSVTQQEFIKGTHTPMIEV
jgi:hypothetical protein